MSLFTVDETQTAIRFQLGEIVQANYKPGLHWKWPLINNVRKFDRRLQTLDTEPERFLTAEKKNVIVDSFAMWRIEDVRQFYTTVGGDATQANVRLDQIVKDGLRSEFSKRTIQEVVSGDRDADHGNPEPVCCGSRLRNWVSPQWTCESSVSICRRM